MEQKYDQGPFWFILSIRLPKHTDRDDAMDVRLGLLLWFQIAVAIVCPEPYIASTPPRVSFAGFLRVPAFGRNFRFPVE